MAFPLAMRSVKIGVLAALPLSGVALPQLLRFFLISSFLKECACQSRVSNAGLQPPGIPPCVSSTERVGALGGADAVVVLYVRLFWKL